MRGGSLVAEIRGVPADASGGAGKHCEADLKVWGCIE